MVPIDELSNDEIQREKWIIWKNVGCLGASFMFHFTASNALTDLQVSLTPCPALFIETKRVVQLQSSVNVTRPVLGITSQAVYHGSVILSSVFLPSLVTSKLGLKWTMIACQLVYSVFILAQFYPSFYTLIPAAIVAGLGVAPMVFHKKLNERLTNYRTLMSFSSSFQQWPRTSLM